MLAFECASTKENLVVNKKVFLSQNYRSDICPLEI